MSCEELVANLQPTVFDKLPSKLLLLILGYRKRPSENNDLLLEYCNFFQMAAEVQAAVVAIQKKKKQIMRD
jgi:hypothetical protein